MYNPFVRACNYTLEALSEIDDIPGLPKFSKENQIVFVRNHDRSIKTGNHQRVSRVKPDIVLLQWDTLKRKLQLPGDASYSRSYKEDICVSKSDFYLFWREIRSTVEMKITGLTKRKSSKEVKNFDVDFQALNESPPYTSLDDPVPDFFYEVLPEIQCE